MILCVDETEGCHERGLPRCSAASVGKAVDLFDILPHKEVEDGPYEGDCERQRPL